MKIDFQYIKNADIYMSEIEVDKLYRLAVISNDYQPLFQRYAGNQNEKYKKYLYSKYVNILEYDPVHSGFIIPYITFYNNVKAKNICLFTSTPTPLEAILYSTINQNKNIIQYNLNDGNPMTYKLF